MQESCLFTYVQNSPQSTGEPFHWTQQDLFQLKWPFGNFFVLGIFQKATTGNRILVAQRKIFPLRGIEELIYLLLVVYKLLQKGAQSSIEP